MREFDFARNWTTDPDWIGTLGTYMLSNQAGKNEMGGVMRKEKGIRPTPRVRNSGKGLGGFAFRK
jgi:hypothetical protein